MPLSPPFHEDDLLAFVDGEANLPASTAIRAFLAASPEHAAKVETWQAQNAFLRASFEAIEHEPIPLSLSLTQTNTFVPARDAQSKAERFRTAAERPAGQQNKRPWVTDFIGYTAGISLAFGSGMLAAILNPYIAASFDRIFVIPPALTPEAAPLSALSSHALKVAARRQENPPPDAEKPLDLSIVGLDMTRLNTGAAPLCLSLMTEAKEPLTLCVSPAEAAADPGFKAASSAPFRSIEWDDTAGHFALAGRLPEAALREAGERIRERTGHEP